MKPTLTKEQELAHFDPEKETVIQTDASIRGLGTCLLQDGKPVYYASRAIGEAEKNYVAIELESLAVAWGPRKTASFHLWQEVQTSNRPETTGNNPKPQPKCINTQTTMTAKPSIPVRL